MFDFSLKMMFDFSDIVVVYLNAATAYNGRYTTQNALSHTYINEQKRKSVCFRVVAITKDTIIPLKTTRRT